MYLAQKDRQTNEQTAAQWKVPKVYSSYQELVENEKKSINAVVILTPTPLHFEMIAYLLANNINIICEKPLVGSYNVDFFIKNKKFTNFLKLFFCGRFS